MQHIDKLNARTTKIKFFDYILGLNSNFYTCLDFLIKKITYDEMKLSKRIL